MQSHMVGHKVFIEQEVPALTRVVNGQTEHARMNLVFNLNGSVTYLDVSIVAPLSCNPSLVSQQPVQNQDLWPKERKRTNLADIHTSTSFLPSSRPQVGLAHMPGDSSATSCQMPITRHWPSGTPGQPSKVCSTATIVAPSFLSMHRASGCKYRPNGNAHTAFSVSSLPQPCHVALL